MTVGNKLGVVVASFLLCMGAQAEVTCAECKASALAEASLCRVQAAPDAALMASCDKKYSEMGLACQETACRVDAGAQAAARCADCEKGAEAEAKKCLPLPAEVRGACEARVANQRKSCEDRFCPAPKAR